MDVVTISGPAIGKDFFNRERETGNILKILKKDNVSLVAPRRYGKTSLMREVERRLREEGYLCLFLDVMYVDRPEEFVIELADVAFSELDMNKRTGFLEALKSVFKKIGDIIEEASVGGVRIKFRGVLKDEINEDNWTEKGREILDVLKDLHDRKPVFIFIDELPECVNNIIRKKRNARKFLQWFRSVRQGYIKELRFIVGGSISFDRVVKGIGGSSWIVDLRRVYIEGFSKSDALRFIKRCLNEEGVKYKEKIGEKILECIGEPYIPYFIAIFINMLTQESKELNEEFIEEIYHKKLLGVHGRGYFDHYRQRLGMYYPELAKAAEEILKEVCKSVSYPRDLAFGLFKKASGMDDYEKFMDLLSELENDFYIKLDGESLRFQSKVLRDWWRLYYG